MENNISSLKGVIVAIFIAIVWLVSSLWLSIMFLPVQNETKNVLYTEMLISQKMYHLKSEHFFIEQVKFRIKQLLWFQNSIFEKGQCSKQKIQCPSNLLEEKH